VRSEKDRTGAGQQTAASPPRRNVRGESTRARLTQAALESFAANGFHGTGTREIAEAAGLSQAAMYIHYPTKEDLLFQIAIDSHKELEAIVIAAQARACTPQEQLREWVHDFVAWHARSHTRARVINYEMRALSPEHRLEVAKLRRSIGFVLRRIIGEGVEAGVFRVGDTGITANAIVSLGIDIARWYRDDGVWGPEEVAQRYTDLALRIVGC
jgi:AcrR family transcriptional regulator